MSSAISQRMQSKSWIAMSVSPPLTAGLANSRLVRTDRADQADGDRRADLSGVDPLLGGGTRSKRRINPPGTAPRHARPRRSPRPSQQRQRDRLLAEDRFPARGLNRDPRGGYGSGWRSGRRAPAGWRSDREIGVGLHAGQRTAREAPRGSDRRWRPARRPRSAARCAAHDAPHPPQPDHANPNASHERLR